MVTHTISTAIKETWDIDGTDEDWLLAPTGSIAVNATAISIDADHPLNRIVLQGAVTALGHGAIGLDAAAQVKVRVADGAEIGAETRYKKAFTERLRSERCFSSRMAPMPGSAWMTAMVTLFGR